MKREIVCFLCPNSCELKISNEEDSFEVLGNRCPKGAEFAKKEMTSPERTLTTSVKVQNGDLPLVSVRSETSVKKEEMKAIVKQLRDFSCQAPVHIGQVLMCDIGVNHVKIIATQTIRAVK